MRSRIKAFVESNMILPVFKDPGEGSDVATMRSADRLYQLSRSFSMQPIMMKFSDSELTVG